MNYFFVFLILMYQQQSVICFEFNNVLQTTFNQVLEVVGTAYNYVARGVRHLMDHLHHKKVTIVSTGAISKNVRKHLETRFIHDIEPNSKEYDSLKTHPTALMSTDQLIMYHGKKPEIHQVTTADGFVLIIHRVLRESSRYKGTVLLHHGLLGSSADWVLLGADNSLPYILSNAGYDVWMTNARGNYYSRNHKRLTKNMSQFWDFTWQEMGTYDLPAVIDYIRVTKDGTEKMYFVGHSMGASALLVLLSTKVDYNNYIKLGILLAPLAFLNNIKGPLRDIVSVYSKNALEMLSFIDGEYFPKRKVSTIMSTKFCTGLKIYCDNPLLFLAGGLSDSPLTRERGFVARLLYHVPAGGSSKTILHYVQIAKAGKFHEFGNESNEFPLHQVTVPLALFSSSDDWLSSINDVIKLFVNVGKPRDHVVLRGENITHTEFVWGYKARSLVFEKVLDIMETYNPNCTTLNEV